MNIYEMLNFIRKSDWTKDKKYTIIIDFLHTQHLLTRIETKDFYLMLKDILFDMLFNAPYGSQPLPTVKCES